ncbi:NAD(P)H-binding protein [Amaricoccus sp. W119]|uniref:NAD(P)H-binding protein n=1 Tax=Amaricoccus sp. W119 TaxID=3391833 RepID=UPI0039A5A971
MPPIAEDAASAPYCVIGCTRGTGLRIARQLVARGAAVRGVARAPGKARGLLPAGVDIRAGDVTDRGSLGRAGLGDCRAIFFAVDVTGGIAGRGFFKPSDQIRAVTYQGLVNAVEAAKAAGFSGRFVLLSGMGSELPSFAGRLLNTIKGDLQGNQRDRDAYLRGSGLDWSIGRGGILTNEPAGRADIRVTPPVHRLSLCRRVARPDFARALIVAADTPAASRRMFDVFNARGSAPAEGALVAQLERLGPPVASATAS